MQLDDIPHLFSRVAEFAAGHAGAEAIVADADRVVLDGVGKVVLAFGHGSYEHTDAFLGAEILNVVSHANDGGFETQRYLAAIGRKVIRDRVADDLE